MRKRNQNFNGIDKNNNPVGKPLPDRIIGILSEKTSYVYIIRLMRTCSVFRFFFNFDNYHTVILQLELFGVRSKADTFA